jgi:hypothetical protein
VDRDPRLPSPFVDHDGSRDEELAPYVAEAMEYLGEDAPADRLRAYAESLRLQLELDGQQRGRQRNGKP